MRRLRHTLNGLLAVWMLVWLSASAAVLLRPRAVIGWWLGSRWSEWAVWAALAAGCAVWACWYAVTLLDARAVGRARRGLCPHCGYDLRATPGRCPECGAVPGTEGVGGR